MEVTLSLLGVLVGWSLAVASEEWRRRRESRSAAAIVWAELLENENTLKTLSADLPAFPFRRLAWDTYGVSLLRTCDKDTVASLVEAYSYTALAEYQFEFYSRVIRELEDVIESLADRRAEAVDAGRTKLAQHYTDEIRGRAPGLDDLRSGLDKFLSEVDTAYLPRLVRARERVQRINGID